MENTQQAYNGEFTIEERKFMTAEALLELRKGKKWSQKEVAAKLDIKPSTYNTYESGRTEPPIEILVRLSYLYEIPIDVIVQRDRTFKTADDVSKQIAACRQQLAAFDKESIENSSNPALAVALLATMEKLADAMESYSKTEAVQKALNEKEKK